MTDPISDMLTRIRNALFVKKAEVVLPYSKLKAALASVFAKHGWIAGFETIDESQLKYLKLKLKYNPDGQPAISGLQRVSKPGQRIYAKMKKIPRVTYGIGSTIVSTSKGIMTGSEARKEKLGGEVICQIW